MIPGMLPPGVISERMRKHLEEEAKKWPDKHGRQRPDLDDDYYGELYIVVDDDGDPVSDYYSDLDVAQELRDNYWPDARIFEVAFKVVGIDDPEPPTLVDDPRDRKTS